MNTKDTQINEVLCGWVFGHSPDNIDKWKAMDFTHSLDACGVIVEKLGMLEAKIIKMSFSIKFVFKNGNIICSLDSWDWHEEGRGPTMPAAFCNAVMKIVEGENGGTQEHKR